MAYKVIYDREACIGANACVGALPDFWSLDAEKKAVLKGAQLNAATGRYELAISKEELDRFTESAVVCPVYVIDIVDANTGKSILNLNPGETEQENAPVIRAKPDAAPAQDSKGYFTIRVVPEQRQIKAYFYSPKHQLLFVVEGSDAESIRHTLLREGFVSSLAHAAYLGGELQKAEIALKKNLAYVQDQPLP